MEENTKGENDIIKRLNILIALNMLALAGKKTEAGVKENIQFLYGFGLSNSEIAEILGKTTTHVNKEIHFIKKDKLKK